MAKAYNPRMHTVEHVLNQTMVRRFACGRCFSSHLNPDKSKCDYYFERPLEEQEAKDLEKEVNAVLARRLPVREYPLNREEAAQKVSLSRLPASEKNSAGDIRIVEIGDYDLCPCIGEHVPNTSEVGRFILVSHSFTPAGEIPPRHAPEAARVAIDQAQDRPAANTAPSTPGVLRLRFKLGAPPADDPKKVAT